MTRPSWPMRDWAEIRDGDPHRESTEYIHISYWKRQDDGSVASAKSQATHAEVSPCTGGGGGWPTVTFKLPEQKRDMKSVYELCRSAFENGRKDHMAEVRTKLCALAGVEKGEL